MHSFLYNKFSKLASFLFELFKLCLDPFHNVFIILFPLEYYHYVSITSKLFFQPLCLCLSFRFSSCLNSTNCVLVHFLHFVSFRNVWVLLIAFDLLSLCLGFFHHITNLILLLDSYFGTCISRFCFCLSTPFIIF